jgi:hypothetical protein
MKPTSRNAKKIIWRKRFGVPEHFAFSGICSGPLPVCYTKNHRITGWRLHHHVPRAKGGSASA